VLTTRIEDRARLLNPGARYWVVPFSLDANLYEPVAACDRPIVGLIGSMHWYPSKSAAERLIRNIWPLVHTAIPTGELRVAGWNARQALSHIPTDEGITIIENVAHPREFFSTISVMVYAPRRGSGCKVKVMEAMAYGVPVVTTWEGREGLDVEDGVHCLVRETDEDIADAVVRLLRDAELRRKLRRAGRELIETRYAPARVVDELLCVYEQLS
jgi:hypothetical protein